MDTYLKVNEVAELMKLSVQTIRRYTMKKEIPFHKINRTVRYKKSEIEKWVENRDLVKAKEHCKNIQGGLFNETEPGGEA